MSVELLLLLSMLGSVLTSALMWGWLRTPLTEMLCQLCMRPGGIRFWSRYTLLMLTVAPLVAVIFLAPFADGYSVASLRQVLLAILLGHFVAFALVGRSLFKAVHQAMAGPQQPVEE